MKRDEMVERLQKIISRAGVASRRAAEKLIASGQVTVNGKRVTELGTKADPDRDHIKVAGKLLHFPETRQYLALNKPAAVVATLSDPEGRTTLRSLLHGVPGRVFPIGRLEFNATGLLLLTNDGDLANLVMQSESLEQTYAVKVKGQLRQQEIERLALETGIRLRPLGRAENAWYECTLTDARRDALRKPLLAMGHPVEKVKRTAVDGIELGRLVPGRWRELDQSEVESLRRACKPRAKRRAPVPA